ncbi:MAG: ABC transporter ATP-binding protein [Thermoplasmata archaeon]|jgi:ATP-binding cassette subfamily B protein|nr:ABC transporter ATP-binding protein [Thermoplasmata archaeon]
MFTRFFGKRDWALTAVAFLLIVAQIWMDIRIPDYMGEITDAFLLNDTDVVVSRGWEMIGCALISLTFALITGFVLANISASVGRNMRIAQFDQVQAFSEENIKKFSAASLITRSTNDVTQIQNFIARGLQIFIRSPIIAIWAIIMISGSSLEWTAVTAAGVAVLIIVMMVTLHFAKIRFMRIQWLTDDVNRATRESIDGIRVIRAYNAEGYQEGRFSEANDNLLRNNISASKIMAPAYPIAQSTLNFVIMGIYWVGAGLILGLDDTNEQLLLFSDMIVFTSYATMVISAFMQLFGMIRAIPRTSVGLKRVQEVVDTKPTVIGGEETEGTEHGCVEFRDVSFSYPGSGKKALDGISFRVEEGKTLAIIGTTGSGKTTLVNLITRFYDATEGTVMVDGLDIKEFDLRSLRSKMGYVSQSSIIFSGSVDMNVNYGLGSENRTEDDIRKALEIAQADEFVYDMPDGRESHVSQHGKNLSGGQKQRISIARALCRSPEILILDDSFSALDYKTDLELRNALDERMGGTTRIIVAQRVGTIKDADEILVLDEGRLVGKGTHRHLMESCPLYREIAESQAMQEGVL